MPGPIIRQLASAASCYRVRAREQMQVAQVLMGRGDYAEAAEKAREAATVARLFADSCAIVRDEAAEE